MRILFLASALASVFTPAAFAQDATPAPKPAPKAQPNSYISVSAGYVGGSDYDYPDILSTAERETDGGIGIGGAYGMIAGDHFRWEVGGAYRKHDVASEGFLDGGDITILTLDANAYYDFTRTGAVQPYVGAGLGIAGVAVDDGVFDDDGSALHVQVMGGASVPINDTISLFAEARYDYVSFKVEATDSGGDVLDDDHINLGGFGGAVGVRFGF